MVVLIVCHDYKLSGANGSLIDWLQAHKCAGDNIHFVVLLPRHDKTMEHQLVQAGCTVWIGCYTVPVRRVVPVSMLTHLKDYLKNVYSLVFDPLIALFIARKARRAGVKLVHSNSFSVVLGCKIAHLLHVPHVWHIREFMDADYGIQHLRRLPISRYCAVSHALFISSVIRDYYQQRYCFASQRVIVDQVRVDTTYHKQRGYMEDGICRLLLAGNISEGKGQREAIRAAKLLHKKGLPVHLDLCGQGDLSILRDELSDETSSYITYLGYRKDLTAIRKNEDIALVCSRLEALGRVTIESFYYRNLIVGADSGATAKLVVNKQNGFLYRHGDVQDLAQTIAQCMNMSDKMVEIIESHAQKNAIETYSQPIYPEIIDYYQACLAN